MTSQLVQRDAADLICPYWAQGHCKRGEECRMQHPAGLDWKLTRSRKVDFSVPNDGKTACARCMDLGIVCDKRGRGASSDPCSECRWFGGAKVMCLLSASTYNDHLWYRMMNRPDHGFDLGPQPQRDAVSRSGKLPGPIDPERLMPHWHGSTRDELLTRPNWLPDDVRQRPRAYLMPPPFPAAFERAADEMVRWERRMTFESTARPATLRRPVASDSTQPIKEKEVATVNTYAYESDECED